MQDKRPLDEIAGSFGIRISEGMLIRPWKAVDASKAPMFRKTDWLDAVGKSGGDPLGELCSKEEQLHYGFDVKHIIVLEVDEDAFLDVALSGNDIPNDLKIATGGKQVFGLIANPGSKEWKTDRFFAIIDLQGFSYARYVGWMKK